MYKIAEYSHRIASEDTDTQEKYEIIKSLSKNFTISNEIALKLDEEISKKLSGTEEPVIEIDIPEIEIKYLRPSKHKFEGPITSSDKAANFLREIMGDQISLYEQFIVLFLNRANSIIGYYKHSKGGISGTVVDIRLILVAAIKSLASGMVLCHNHPSGSLRPSEQDKSITKKLKTVTEGLEINVLDHVIITTESYFSFSDDGLLGLSNDSLDGYNSENDQNNFERVDEDKLKKLIIKANNIRF